MVNLSLLYYDNLTVCAEQLHYMVHMYVKYLIVRLSYDCNEGSLFEFSQSLSSKV